MRMKRHELLNMCGALHGDGRDSIPPLPGVYALVNRMTHRVYVGSAWNLRQRCHGHMSGLRRGQANGLIRRDLHLHGGEHFVCIVLESFASDADAGGPYGLGACENAWILRLDAHLEQTGYNSMIYNDWTKGASFRDRERKLLRWRSYELLDDVDLYDPISEVLLGSWTRDPDVYGHPRALWD